MTELAILPMTTENKQKVLEAFLVVKVRRNDPNLTRAYSSLVWTVIWDFGNATTTEQPYSHQMPKAGCPDKR